MTNQEDADAAKEEEALARLQAGINASEEDYLDSNLESEEKFLRLYKSFTIWNSQDQKFDR